MIGVVEIILIDAEFLVKLELPIQFPKRLLGDWTSKTT